MNTLNIWFSHNKTKRNFCKRNGITISLPILEVLIASMQVIEERGFFTAKSVKRIMRENNLQKTDTTLYNTLKSCRMMGYIDPYNLNRPGRRWFEPHKYLLTAKGNTLLYKFKNYLEQKS